MKQLFMMMFVMFFLCASVSLYAQKDTVDVASDVTEGNLNNAVQEAIDGGTLDNTVFRLEPYGYYVLSGEIVTPQGSILDIYAPEPGTTQLTAPPQIVWTASAAPSKDRMFDLQGDFYMKNVWVRYADIGGVQVGTTIQFEDDEEANASGKGERGVFEGCIFDYSRIPPTNSGGAINILAKRFKGTFKNCYFRNCADPHYRYYGRAVSFPYNTEGWHNDSLFFENCTFANMGYVIMQESDEYSDNVFFNHCTFINIVVFSLESGWWYKLAVNNCIWVNAYMYGYVPPVDELPLPDPGSGSFDVQGVEDFAFIPPFTDEDRRILFTHTSYFQEDWLVDWQTTSSPYAQKLFNERKEIWIPQPQPILSPSTFVFFDSISTETDLKAYPYINRANLYYNYPEYLNADSTDPGFVNPPTNVDSIKLFLQEEWDTQFDVPWAWNTRSGWVQEWPLPEDLSYTNTFIKTAAMGGFPLGDLYHWWPEEYTQWEAQKEAEYDRIITWMETGQDPVGIKKLPGNTVPERFTLSQNYPNPFNPTTQIEYSVPRTGKVSLIVYNTLGQEVATLFEGDQRAGNYVATFDGSELASGVYMYQLKSGNVSITKKFVLMK